MQEECCKSGDAGARFSLGNAQKYPNYLLAPLLLLPSQRRREMVPIKTFKVIFLLLRFNYSRCFLETAVSFKVL